MKLSERLRKANIQTPYGDGVQGIQLEAAELLDECERFIKRVDCGCVPIMTCARCATLAKLRAQENADE